MANGSEHMTPAEQEGAALENLRKKLNELPPGVVYYPSPLGNLQQCTRCKIILTNMAERCPVCNAPKRTDG